MKALISLISLLVTTFTVQIALAQEAELNTEGKIEATMQDSQEQNERTALRPMKDLTLKVLGDDLKKLASLKEQAKSEKLKTDITGLENTLIKIQGILQKLDNEADRSQINDIAKLLTGEINGLIRRIEFLIEDGY